MFVFAFSSTGKKTNITRSKFNPIYGYQDVKKSKYDVISKDTITQGTSLHKLTQILSTKK